MSTIEHLVFLVNVTADSDTRAPVCMLRVQGDSTTAHRLARANGFKNYDLVKRVIFESGEYNDIGVNCVRDPAAQEFIRRRAAKRAHAARLAWAARRNGAPA